MEDGKVEIEELWNLWSKDTLQCCEQDPDTGPVLKLGVEGMCLLVGKEKR